MAPVTPPAWQQAGSYSARLDRQVLAGLITPNLAGGLMVGRGGVKPSGANTSIKVTQRASPDMWVTVAMGTCYIPATSTTGGSYICHNDAAYDVQITSSHATLARKDLIIARVKDAVDDTGAINAFTIEVVTGTAAGSPSAPALPSQSINLAELLIPAASSSVTNANITDRRTRVVGLGGVLPIANTSDWPSGTYPGHTVYRDDSGLLQFWNGSTWRTVIDDASYPPTGAWSTYTVNWSSGGTQPGLGNGTQSGRYTKIGRTVTFTANIVSGGTTSYGTGNYSLSLPVQAASNGIEQIVTVRVYDGSVAYGGVGLIGSGSSTVLLQAHNGGSLLTVTNTFPSTWTSGDQLRAMGTYEAAS
jgi:hypothetical protein